MGCGGSQRPSRQDKALKFRRKLSQSAVYLSLEIFHLAIGQHCRWVKRRTAAVCGEISAYTEQIVLNTLHGPYIAL